ncbi:MAG: 5-carboxymethyl-2-hydroxymuconate Delta-isomerase [Bdellovibrionales bacterium]
MPHIILEHNSTDKALVAKTCELLHKTLSEQETVKLGSIKTRSVFIENLVLGDGTADEDFAHVQLKLLPGRTEKLRVQMSKALLEVLQSQFGTGSLSVEVIELASYSKV